MKKVLALVAFAAISAMTAFAGEWKGVIADSKCKHTDGTDKSVACTQTCVKGGSEAVFVTSDDKVLKIDAASKEKIMPHLGHKVTVTGTVEKDVLKVDTIKM